MAETKSVEQRTLEAMILAATAATATATEAARLASIVATTLSTTTTAMLQSQATIIALLQQLVRSTSQGNQG
jgi:hypothetical protein